MDKNDGLSSASRGLIGPRDLLVLISCVLLFFGSPGTIAQSAASQYEIESAYLFNFGKFVRPAREVAPANRATFDICIVGQDTLGHTLDAIASNERLDGRAVRIRRMKSVPDSPSCDVVYFSASEDGRIGRDLSVFEGSETLTVSDAPDFLKNGGMIQFVLISNHVRFAINLDPVRQNHLVLSSELLRVASSIVGAPQPEVRP